MRAAAQVDLKGGWSISTTPEFDAVHNRGAAGEHFATVQVVGLNKDVGRGVTLSAELWGQYDDDPSGAVTQASFDLEFAWVPPKLKTVQLDAQVNLGLNHATPDVQWIVGVSKRF